MFPNFENSLEITQMYWKISILAQIALDAGGALAAGSRVPTGA